VTNGETTDYADKHDGTISFTPELETAAKGAVRVPGQREAEFVSTLPFDLSLATAAHVATSDSAVGATDRRSTSARPRSTRERRAVDVRLA
jgi:hypothetical protein